MTRPAPPEDWMIHFTPTRVYIMVPGIHSQTGDHNNWAPIYSDCINALTNSKGTEFRYFSTFATRRLKLTDHATEVRDLIMFYYARGFEVILVAHSNGNEVCRRALSLLPEGFKVQALHAIAAATYKDFSQADDFQSWNTILSVKLNRMFVYCSDTDSALKRWAGLSKKFLGWIGLGFGQLGLRGPVKHNREAVTVLTGIGYDHGTWFDDEHFYRTLLHVLTDENLPRGHVAEAVEKVECSNQ